MHGSRRAGGSGPGARDGAGPDQQHHHRRGHRQHRRHPARRHRRGIIAGPHRGESRRHLGRRRSVHPGRPASRHLQPDLHAARLLGRRGREPGAAGRVYGHGGRGALGRRARGDGDRLRRGAGRRRAVDPPGGGARRRGARRHSDRPQHAVDRAAHRRHQAEPSRGRPVDGGAADRHDDPRHELAAGQRGRRRAARQRHRPRRRHPELPQRAVRPGDDLRDERHDRRDLGGRGAHQHDPARGRQHLQRAVLHGVLQRRAGRRPHERPGGDRGPRLVFRGQRPCSGTSTRPMAGRSCATSSGSS